MFDQKLDKIHFIFFREINFIIFSPFILAIMAALKPLQILNPLSWKPLE